MDQNRAIQDFLSNLSTKFSALDKRLTGLESFEYTSTNYYGTEGIKSYENYVIALPTLAYSRVRGMYSRNLKGFTFDDCALVCDRGGIYLAHYCLGVTLVATLTVTSYLATEDSSATIYSYASANGVSGTKCWLAKTVLLDLEAGESAYINIGSSVAPTTVTITNASLTIHRIADN